MRQTSAVFLAVLSGWLPRAGSPFTQVPSAPSATGVTAPGPLPGGGERSTGDAVALVVDGEPIPAAQYGEWLLRTHGTGLAPVFAREHWLLERAAREKGVAPPTEAVDAEIDRVFAERIAGAFHGSKEEWLAELARTGRSETGLRLQRRVETRDRMNGRALAAIDRVVPREKIEREWWLKYGRHGRKYDLRLIQFDVRVETPESASNDARAAAETRARDARRADAERVRALALAGADFGQLAQENSSDPETRARRGKPASGLFDHQGWPSSFLDALEKLEPGAVSEPLYARGGWWLVQVRDVKVTPLDSVRDALAADLLARGPEDDEVELVRQALFDGVHVQVLPGMTSPPSDPELSGADVPALSIGGVPVSRGEYATWVMDVWGETFARTFVEDLLVQRKAAALGLKADEEEVQARAREYVQDIVDRDFMEDRQRWYEKLHVQGETEEDFLREQCTRLRTSILVEKLIQRDRVVTDADVRRRFETSLGPDGAWREMSKILVSSRYEELDHGQPREELARELDAAIAKAHTRALDIVARVRAGADFAAIARAESDDLRTRSKGGVIAGAFRSDEYPDEVAKAALALPQGAVSDPIASGPAWYVFWARSVTKPTFEEKKEALREELLTLRPGLLEVRTYRNVLANGAKLEYRPRPLR